MQAWQKIQIGIASTLICLGIASGVMGQKKQANYDAELNKQQTILTQKKKQLSSIQADNENMLLDKKQNANNQATSESIRQVMLNRAIKTRAVKVAKALFNYTDASDYLKRQNKVSVLLDKKQLLILLCFLKQIWDNLKVKNCR